MWLSRLWSGWEAPLTFVQPRTVIAWQRRRFRKHWRRLSQRGPSGRPAVPKEIRDLIRELLRANPLRGSPRIVGELRKLGIQVAKSTVETYRARLRKPPSPTWKTFLHNHVKDVIALDFFVVPTVTHTVLFVRLIGSIRRDRLDHAIVLHERHLRRLLTGYGRYDHDWRTHRALDMDCPVPRPVQRPEVGLIREVPEVGGLHYHDERRAA